ncbi:DUF1410 domain-containing protein [Ureaplasma parvum]|uniref:DUF1410 domain-containing protein n=1 Tax=Ureaplasma parvum TaxID=134821 RepID=UPI001154A3BD|nr:DUF1410 domain-containing protein [Ureaplasma parvum]QDI64360.1 DUF1410 domain-containing protein [Ureaplasma parvum]
MNYQTVNFEQVPNQNSASTPATKEKSVVSNVELVEQNAQLKKAKVKLTFSKAITLENEAQASLKLTLTKKGTQETKVVDLVLNQDKTSATTKDLVEFTTDVYQISKLTLNDVEVNVDSVKNNDLKIAESTTTPKEDKAVVSKVELVEQNAQLKKAKVKLTFSKAITLENEAQASLKLTLTKKGTQETKVVDLVLNQDKTSATTKDLVEFTTDVYQISKLTLNDVEVNVDSVKNNDLKIAESTTTPKEDKAVVSKVELVEQNAQLKKAKVKLTFSKAITLENEAQASLKLTLTKKGTQETKVVDLVLNQDKTSATTKDLVEFTTDVYQISKLTLNDVEVNVDSVKNNDLKIAESTTTPKEDKAVVSKVELVEQNAQLKKAKVKLTFSKAITLENEAQASLKLTLTKKGTQETKVVDLVLNQDKTSATTKDLVEFTTDVYQISKLTLNDVEVNVDSVKNNDLKIAESTTTPKEDKAVVSKVELVEQNAQLKKAKVKLTFSKAITLENEAQASLKLTLTKKGTQETKVVDLVLNQDKTSATTKDLVEFTTDVYQVSKLTLNDVEVNVDSVKNNDLKIA